MSAIAAVSGSKGPDAHLPGTPLSTDLHEEELRIALAMNGGVSLAVWIGGVSLELARLVAGDSTYGELLDLAKNRARVDVIAGTSAGGINGAYLAMAVAHHGGKRSFLPLMQKLRSLWVNRASISSLLRSPFEVAPPSLLDGDGVFLDELRDAFRSLWSRSPTPPREAPVDLLITTTLLQGRQRRRYADDLGNPVGDVDHRARFRFCRGSGIVGDPFATSEIAERLALAARCTASFPGAFEASYCSIGKPARGRPDMAGAADFSHSGYVIDGGVLDNKPVAAALEGVFRQRAEGPVRRILAYVVPDPEATARGPSADDGGAEQEKPDACPTLLQVVLASLTDIPRVQSVSAQLDALREHNTRVRERRHARILLTSHTPPEAIDALSETLFQAYREYRVAGGLDHIIAALSEGLMEQHAGGRGLSHSGRREWLHAHILALRDELPWVPFHPPFSAHAATERSAPGWRWGTRPVEHAARILLDIVVRTQGVAAAVRSSPSLKEAGWDPAYEALEQARVLRTANQAYWKGQAEAAAACLGNSVPKTKLRRTLPGDKAQKWFRGAVAGWARQPVGGSDIGVGETSADELAPAIMRRVASALVGLDAAVVGLAASVPALCDRGLDEDLRQLLGLYRYFVRTSADTVDAVIPRLLAFEVVQDALGGRDNPAAEQELGFVQISGVGPAVLGGAGEVERKLAGSQLAHFGAFYKQSWRANDWLWGRLDAVRHLVPILLDPERLRVVSRSVPIGRRATVFAEQIERIALGCGQNGLDVYFERTAVLEELAYLDEPDLVVPELLPASVAAVARRIELGVLEDELPQVARAIDLDRQARAHVGEAAEAFRTEVGALPRDGGLEAKQAARLLDLCRVGAEKFENEVGTDRLSTMATQTVAVGVAALRANNGLAEILGATLSVLQRTALLVHVYTRNAADRSRTALTVISLLVGAGLVVVVTAIAAKEVYPEVVVLAGTATVLAGLSLGILSLGRRAITVLVTIVVSLAVAMAGLFIASLSGVVSFDVLTIELDRRTWRGIALVEGVLLALLLFGAVAARVGRILRFVRRRRHETDRDR